MHLALGMCHRLLLVLFSIRKMTVLTQGCAYRTMNDALNGVHDQEYQAITLLARNHPEIATLHLHRLSFLREYSNFIVRVLNRAWRLRDRLMLFLVAFSERPYVPPAEAHPALTWGESARLSRSVSRPSRPHSGAASESRAGSESRARPESRAGPESRARRESRSARPTSSQRSSRSGSQSCGRSQSHGQS